MKTEIIEKIIAFRDARQWKPYHTGENLAKSICIEASELLELFQWESEIKNIERLKEELADVLIYSLTLAHEYQLDVEQIILDKIEKNGKKYPPLVDPQNPR